MPIKKRKNESVLMPHLGRLLEMKKQKISLGMMQNYLENKNVFIKSTATISRFLSKYEDRSEKIILQKKIGSTFFKCCIIGDDLIIQYSCKPSFLPPEFHSVSIPFSDINDGTLKN